MVSIDPWATIGFRFEAARAALSRPGTELYIAHEPGKRSTAPVAFLLLNPHGLASAPYINSIAVDPAHQGRGIGTLLLAFAEERFRARRFIYLCVSSFNLRAQQLYRRLGYTQVAELEEHAVDGHSELLMRKPLPRSPVVK